jgi:4-hydroxybutyrate CoA-transferase
MPKFEPIRFVSPEEAVKMVVSGNTVYIGSNCSQPQTLTKALYDRREELEDVEIVHLLLSGEAPYANPDCAPHLHHTAYFVAKNTRGGIRDGSVDYVPIFLSEIPQLFYSKQVPVDVAMISVSPPNSKGYVSMGISVDLGFAACKSAKIIIAEVQPEMPYTYGDNKLHVSEIDAFVESKFPILEHKSDEPDEASKGIAKHVSGLIKDGSCLQVGIGRIPDAVLDLLFDKNDLGIHSELIGDGVVDLWENGNITGLCKQIHREKVVTTFALASKRLYEVVDRNPEFEFHPTEMVNDPFIVSQNENVVAINGALQVDLTGQVVSDSIGHSIYSGFGGQVDFIRGAARSKGGKPIIVIPSTAKGGSLSRITGTLTPGAGVVTSRADVHWVITEFGAANLHGMSIRKRAEALIEISHPDFREQLREEARQIGLFSRSAEMMLPMAPTR